MRARHRSPAVHRVGESRRSAGHSQRAARGAWPGLRSVFRELRGRLVGRSGQGLPAKGAKTVAGAGIQAASLVKIPSQPFIFFEGNRNGKPLVISKKAILKSPKSLYFLSKPLDQPHVRSTFATSTWQPSQETTLRTDKSIHPKYQTNATS